MNFLPTPDNVIVSSYNDRTFASGVVSTMNHAKEALLTCRLDKSKNLVTAQSVNPEGYLTQLDSLDSSNQEIQDLKKLRLLIRAMISSNPNQAQTWLAASRLEEKDSNVKAAKQVLQEACLQCPDSEDIWIEAARLETFEKSKEILNKATTRLPKSIKLWLAAVDKESNSENKLRVLKKALEMNPESVKLWKEAVALSDEKSAVKYLEKAVICAPHSLELWLALAKLLPYKEARRTLNNARKQLPLEASIWISAAKLEESEGNLENSGELIRRGIKTLVSNGVDIIRTDWLNEAIIAEKSQCFNTAKSIIKNCFQLAIQPDQKIETWANDLKSLEESGCVEATRFLYQQALDCEPNAKSLWKIAYFFEKKMFGQEKALQVLSQACEKCKDSGKFWVVYMQTAPFQEVFHVFAKAIETQPSKIKIYIAAYKVFMKTFAYAEAEKVLEIALERCYCAKIVQKSISFYKILENLAKSKEIAEKAISDFPYESKIYIKLSSLCEEAEAREILKKGLKKINHCGHLWIALAKLEENSKNDLKCRYFLEKGRNLSTSVDVHLTSIDFELSRNNSKAAEFILNKALQIFPNDGRLWAFSIMLSDVKVRKTKTAEALERCADDPYILLSIAQLFQSERKFEKARAWYEKGLGKGSRLGDIWIYYYDMEMSIGEVDRGEKILTRSLDKDIRKGKVWEKNKSTGKNDQIIKKARENLVNI